MIALLVTLAVIGGGAFAVAKVGMPLIEQFTGGETSAPADFPGHGHDFVEVTIPAGATGAQMAQVLYEAGVVASTGAFISAFNANPAAAGIQPGTYRLRLEMKASYAVEALLNRENKVQTRVTIPEGLRLEQILERLSSVTAIPLEDFEAAMADPETVGLPSQANGNYEGWLFASTYTFEPGTTPTEMIAEMIARTVQILDSHDVRPRDRMEVLTMASLIEREARFEEDRRMVARAILNRLDAGQRLEIDASVAYGLNKPGTELTRADLQRDGPYNTYTRSGLPPTPIASPSEMSIMAVLDPADGPWFFWVTVDLNTGETKFAETYDEHLRNVAELDRWRAENS
jgi:UPF0755 protein